MNSKNYLILEKFGQGVFANVCRDMKSDSTVSKHHLGLENDTNS